MEIKRNDALRYTTTVETAKQSEFTEDVAKFRRTQENANTKQQDGFEDLSGFIDDLLNPSGNPLDSIEIKPDFSAHLHRPETKDGKSNTESKLPESTLEINDKQKLFTDLSASNQKEFNKLPEISVGANKKQTEFTEAAADFKETQKEAEHEAFRKAAEGTFNDILTGSGPNIGERIAEAKRKSRQVSTPESYTKQKLFTELMESNKKALDKK